MTDAAPGDVRRSPGERAVIALTRKDFVSDQEVRWCPGCGDYSILAQTQKVMPDFGVPAENIVFISGIGCSGRLPYYMNTYGFHTIHGRAPTLATGLKAARPDLMVWVITGDGDALSIGGNHVLHSMRRNVDIKMIMFNNRIYGLTKGQASPTSEFGKRTKSTPMGSVDYPIMPLTIALAAEATFVARTVDTHTEHLQTRSSGPAATAGSAFVEVLQNCNIFNDGAWRDFTDRDVRDDRMLVLEHGKPMIFGKDRDKGIRLQRAPPGGRDARRGRRHGGGPARPRRGRPRTRTSRSCSRACSGRTSRSRSASCGRSTARPTIDLVDDQIRAAEKSGEGDLEKVARRGDLDGRIGSHREGLHRTAGGGRGDGAMLCPACGTTTSRARTLRQLRRGSRAHDVPEPATEFQGHRPGRATRRARAPPVIVPPDPCPWARLSADARGGTDCLLVCEGDRLIGIFTDRDAVVKAAGAAARRRGTRRS
jgi:2-oxoglutarate/2-oxoacid ferredoxin oxidoreductase subunit beta